MTSDHNAQGDALGGFGLATKSIQTFATEVARLSKESVDETTQLVEKLRSAKTIEDVVSIQTSYVQQSFSKYADYTRRIGELFTALPLEIAKQSQAVLHKTSENITKAADQAGHQLQQGAEQVSGHVQHASEQFSNQVEQAPQQFQQAAQQFDPAPQQGYHNHDNSNQNYNNNNQTYNNDQNYNNNQNYNNQNY